MNTLDRTTDMRRVISLFKNQNNAAYTPGLDPVWRDVLDRPGGTDPPPEPDGQPQYFNDLMEYLRQRNAAVTGRANNASRDRLALQ